MPFQLPEDVSSLDSATLSALLTEALDEFRNITLSDDSSDDEIATAESLADAIEALREARETLAQQQEAREARLTALRSVDVTDFEGVEVVEEVVEPVAAAAPPAKPNPARRVAERTPEIKQPAKAPAVILASADVPGFGAGQELDSLSVAAQALISRTRVLPQSGVSGTHRFGAAQVRRSGYGEFVQTPGGDDYSLIERAGTERRLPGGSLTAAGGWCAPSESWYDLCAYETLDGIVDLPEVNVTRGGIRYTPGPDFADIYAGAFKQTETEAIAATAKTCVEVDCPTFDDVRLEAVGICITAPLLTNAAFPELVRRYIEGGLVAVEHKANAAILAAMETAAGVAIQGDGAGGSMIFSLGSIEWQAQTLRGANRLALNSTIEVILPAWVKPLIRADLANRGGVDLVNVTDAYIDQFFSVRNLRVQFVYDWQDLTVTNGSAALPAEAKALLYPAGTWVKGTQDVITLDAVYDNASLKANTYTGLFAEMGVLAVQRCLTSALVKIPLCVTGSVGAADITSCMVYPGTGSVT